MMFAVLLAAALNVPPALPRSFVPPKGWTQAKNLPPGGPDAAWVSPEYAYGNNDNLAVTSHPVAPGTTAASEAQEAIREMSGDRVISDSHAESTCKGHLAGWTFDARLPLPDGSFISQVYHIGIIGGRAYAFVFTHKAGIAIESAITDAIQSLCAQ